MVTACAAAGIAVSVAACITAINHTRIRRLPNTDGMPDEVIIQKGHIVDFGAPVTHMIRMSGVKVVEIGTVNGTEYQQLEDPINPNTTAVVHVISVEAVQIRMLSLDRWV